MEKPPLLSEGVFLAGATLAGYAVAFAYEAGYAGHFGVPPDMVSVDLTGVLVALAALLSLIISTIIIASPFILIIEASRWPEPIKRRVGSFVYPLVLMGAYAIWFELSRYMLIAFVASTLGGAGEEFLGPLIAQRGTKGYLEKLAAADARVNPSQQTSFLGWFTENPVRFRFTLLILLAVTVLAAFGVGRGLAVKQDSFYCPVNSDSTVLVRTYGSAVVGARFDPGSHRLLGELVLGTRGEGQWATLTRRKVGRLTPTVPK